MSLEYVSPDSKKAFSAEDGRDVSSGLLQLVTVGEKIAFECLNEPPPAGSPASIMFRGRVEEGPGPDLVMEAFLLMQYASLSGFDHVRAFSALCRSASRATALATLVRGALEAFARTWFISQATDDRDLCLRHLSLLYSDLRYPANLDEELFTRDGDRVDPRAKRAHYFAELARIGYSAPIRTDSSQIVTSMLESEIGDGLGLRKYSVLSSVAHAHRSGLNAFVITDPESGGVAGLQTSVDLVGDLAVHAMAGMVASTEGFVKLFGSDARQVDLVDEATRRAALRLKRMASRQATDLD